MTVRTEQKERTRQDILASATRLLRERGIGGASVAEVMKGAGLTVGGFYAHFESKEALVSASLRQSLRELWGNLVAGAGKLRGVEAVSFVVRRYLSRSHRDHPGEGCPLPAVVADVAQAGEPVREGLAHELGDYADALAECIADQSAPSRQRALALLSLMYGGLSLARALKGTPVSDEILKSCRDFARQAFRND
ncbi:TetR/AcrR family transcriptional regulator [Nannocystis sp. ILAH1]|uniref:TetR/AcrR family transcriptional regulator n=1 Tax=unclassified Nannocystis TaxID=2627009 RepID=UPI00226FBBC8|nr:TetR/AcrR family transcriptional regulator [Nannocystis sp. ILAH1]MCY1071825.1 TetR/AcrR family transcriptional regulator [Nannocystis sp. RBIL2]